jgi:hypothetical protein
MIALILAGTLLSGLVTFYGQISRKKLELIELKKNILPVELMRQRLNHLFARAELDEHPRIFTTLSHQDAVGSALFFTYDYGVDPNPDFSGPVKGMLYLNEKHQLCFATWGGNETRQEIFLEGISTASFSFFDPKKKQWKPLWDKKDPPPPFFKLLWTTTSDPKITQTCAFFFPNTEATISYERPVTSL